MDLYEAVTAEAEYEYLFGTSMHVSFVESIGRGCN